MIPRIAGETPTRAPLRAIVVALVCLAALLLAAPGHGVAQDPASGWSTPYNISQSPLRSWFPDIKVDATGKVHVVWCETERRRDGREYESINYARWDGYHWSDARDIVAAQPDIRRNAIAIGGSELLMVHNATSMRRLGLAFTAAPLEQAWLAPAWSAPRTVNAFGGTYMADIEMDAEGTAHLLFDDWGYDEEEDRVGGYADIFYRRSTDQGRSWTVPVNLSQAGMGSSRGQIKIDRAGGLHATWDEGWDRLTGMGEAHYSTYRYSGDGGLTWTEPLTVATPITGTEQLVSGADGRGGVLLLWRLVDEPEIYYQWTADAGEHWTEPAPIPGVYSRPWGVPFDLYETATDSAGNVHALVVGRAEPALEATLQLYHLMWNGEAWSEPAVVWQGEGYPEYPRLVVSEGNRLHAVWFVRDDLWLGKTYDVWYSERTVAAPRHTPAPTSTPWPSATPTATSTTEPTATPYPTLAPAEHRGAPPSHLTSDSEIAGVLRLGVALAPVGVLLGMIVLAVRVRRRG